MEDEEVFQHHHDTQPYSRADPESSGLKPKSVTNLYVTSTVRGKKRNQSMQFNSATATAQQLLSKKHSNEKSGSIGVGTQADLLTNVESTHQALLRNENQKLQGFAKTRLQQKHERKLFRPKTGVTYTGGQHRSANARNELERSVKTHHNNN